MRLTRDEAFSLVRRAVEALATGDSSAMAEAVRVKARELLGRDSESLSDRNFTRILRDTHDAGAVDVRRRGDSFEVARVEGAVSVADQLSARREAATPVAAPSAPAPRGHGAALRPEQGPWRCEAGRARRPAAPRHGRRAVRSGAGDRSGGRAGGRAGRGACGRRPRLRRRRPRRRRRRSRSEKAKPEAKAKKAPAKKAASKKA